MKKETSVFQWIVLGIFFFVFLIGFFLFATYNPSNKDKNNLKIGNVVIWGTVDKRIMDTLLKNLAEKNKSFAGVVYVEKSLKNYEREILEAIASGKAPDLILLSNRTLLQNKDRIVPIRLPTFTRRDFLNTYVDSASIFLDKKGILAIPFIIDPLVMYYNKSIFASNRVVLPPKKWEEFIELSKKITKKDKNDNILRSTIAFGEAINVNNFKEILSTLIFQLENPIVVYDDKAERYISTVSLQQYRNPSEALLYYTEFSNPTEKLYSWNRTLPNSKEMFISGKLAVYFGFASEIKDIRRKNPNLNFDVAEIPSVTGIDKKTVFANIWAFAVPKAAKNKSGAMSAAWLMSSVEAQSLLSSKTYLPPIRRDLLSKRPKDPFMDIFYKEAVYASSFVDPNPNESDKVFRYMIESVTGGRYSPKDAVELGFKELESLFKGK